MTDEVTSDPLAALRRQWELDKRPKLTLQLAEAHGLREDYLSAITVLRSGLDRHPTHVASRVLLGRYLVELEQWPEARELLEAVTSQDPTHLVANKLLVETCLATGDLAEARNRLDLYSLLNESDPDIEELERRLEGAPQEPAEEAPPPEAGLEPEAALEAEPAPEPEAELAPEPEAELEPEIRLEPEPLEEPGFLPESEEVLRADAGAFGEVAPPPAEPEAGPVTQTGQGLEPPPLPAAPPPPRADEPFGDLGRASESEPALAPADSIFELRRPAAAPEVAAVVPAEPGVPEPEEEEPPATVSLGRLYLDQGHPEDAERAFAAVLEREPENAAARAGLAAARGPREWPLTALDLVPPEILAAGAPEARKRALLTGYLERLRAGATDG